MTKHGKGSSFQTTHVFIAKRGSRGSVPGMAMKQGEENEKEHSRQQTRTSTYEDLLSGDRTGEPERPLRSPAVVRSGSELGGAEPSRPREQATSKLPLHQMQQKRFGGMWATRVPRSLCAGRIRWQGPGRVLGAPSLVIGESPAGA